MLLSQIQQLKGKEGEGGIGGGEVPRACAVFCPLSRIEKDIGSHKGERAEENGERRGEGRVGRRERKGGRGKETRGERDVNT